MTQVEKRVSKTCVRNKIFGAIMGCEWIDTQQSEDLKRWKNIRKRSGNKKTVNGRIKSTEGPELMMC